MKIVDGKIETAEDAREFILGGKATLTLRNVENGQRFTYKVVAAPVCYRHRVAECPQCPERAFFVKVLTGPDNESSFTFLGTIKQASPSPASLSFLIPSPKSPISTDALSFQAFAYVWDYLLSGEIPAHVEVWHEGRCGRCNRKLTVPESVASGFGPECAGRLAVA